jgi:hypothetical protein
MTDLAETGEVPHCIDNIMGSTALRLVDDKRTVESSRFWLAWHGEDFYNQKESGTGQLQILGSTGLFILALIGVSRANLTGERNPSLSRGV